MDDRNDSGQFITIREFFDLRIEPLRQEVKMMRYAIEELSKEMVSKQEWQRIRQQADAHQTQLAEFEDRIEQLEHYHSVGMWAFRTLAGIATAVAIAAMIRFLLG